MQALHTSPHPSRSTSTTKSADRTHRKNLPSPPSSSKLHEDNDVDRVHDAQSKSISASKTPDPSPTSFLPSSDVESGRSRKRVDFTPLAPTGDPLKATMSLKPLPPSRECQSSKSILKPGPPVSPAQEDTSSPADDLVPILQSISPQLAKADQSVKIKAYTSLSSALKTYQGLPDRQIVEERLQSVLESIRVDLISANQDQNSSGSILETQALKALVLIVWNKNLAIHIPDSYRYFILDHSIAILEQKATLDQRAPPKVVVLHYLHLLSTQEFDKKIMSPQRAIRLLEALKDITDCVKGNGVVSERLLVYQRLLEQAKGALRSRPLCWLVQTLSAMTSSVADTRKKALHLGQLAAAHLGSSADVSMTLRDRLQLEKEGEDDLSSAYCRRLERMLKCTEEARLVPQIWSVVILFLKGLEQDFHKWPALSQWLRIIQKCFNNGDSEVRNQANKAWNKLIYVAQPHQDTSSFLAKMLIKPILAQIERPTNGRQVKATKPSALSSYCALLYFALKPPASFAHCDYVWKYHLAPVLKKPFLSNEENSDRACRILASLFWKDTGTLWRSSRAFDLVPLEPEDLPPLDHKWVRSHTSQILENFGLLFQTSNWGSQDNHQFAYIAIAWRHFAKALGDAGRKEVIPSAEAIGAARHIGRFLSQLCDTGPSAINSVEGNFLPLYSLICGAIVSELGFSVFTAASSHLSRMDAVHDHSSPGSVELAFPYSQLRSLQLTPGDYNEAQVVDVASSLISLSMEPRSSIRSRILLCRKCTEIMRSDQPGPPRCQSVWIAAAKAVHTELQNTRDIMSSDHSDVVDLCPDIGRILEAGSILQGDIDYLWSALLGYFMPIAINDGKSTQEIVSLLNQLRPCDSGATTRNLAKVAEMFQAFLPPTVEGLSSQVDKFYESTLSAYRQLVRISDTHLSLMYSHQAPWISEILPRFVTAIIALLQASPAEYLQVCLLEMQQSFALWLEDKSCITTVGQDDGSNKIAQAERLCPAIVESLGRLSDIIDIETFDRLLSAGFSASSGRTINGMVGMWNSSYGTKSLTYGTLLKKALAELMPRVDIELPNMSEHPYEERGSSEIHTSPNGHRPTAPLLDESWSDEDEVPSVKSLGTPFLTKSPKRSQAHDYSQKDSVRIHSSLNGKRGVSLDQLQAQESPFSLPKVSNKLHRSDEPLEDLQTTSEEKTPTLTSRRQKYEKATQLTPTPKSKMQTLRLDEIEFPSSPLSPPNVDVDELVGENDDRKEDNQKDAAAVPSTSYSDDNDFWSASQLSHDLEQVVDSAPGSASGKDVSLPASIPAKRKDSPVNEHRAKKRKATTTNDDCLSSHGPPLEQRQSRSPQTVQGRLDDNRDPSSELNLPAVATLDDRLDPFPSKTTRARQMSTEWLFEEPDPGLGSLTESLAPSEARTGNQDVHQAPASSIRSSGDRGSSGRDANKENRNPADIYKGLLKEVLTRLRQSQAVLNGSDLREVDDLCFEIRVAAQNALMGSTRKMTDEMEDLGS